MKFIPYSLILCVLVGCGEWTKPHGADANPPKPAPVAVTDHGEHVVQFLLKYADALDEAGNAFDRHDPSAKVLDAFGDNQKAARLATLSGILPEIDASRPSLDATDAEREEADKKTAALFHKWASQVRGKAK